MKLATIPAFPVPVTNTDKTFYPAASFTKGDVLAYYRDIAPFMLPHLAGRPVTVKRYPDGVESPFFYEKRCPAAHPDFVKTTQVSSAHYGAMTFCEVNNLRTLLWLANRAAIEFHPYLFQGREEQLPTMMVFDLDPGEPAGIQECLRIAIIVRDLLADLDLVSCIKTSGGKGLHIGVPLHRTTFTQSKHFAPAVATSRVRRFPELVTDRMAKDGRHGRVFIDWSQNDHGKTTACAYTLRAQGTPTVSTPLTWDEVIAAQRSRRPALSFTAPQVLQRMAKLADPFAPILTVQQRLPPAPT